MSHTLTIAVIYRPHPTAKNKLTVVGFLEDLETFIDAFNELTGRVIITGDFNVHFDLPTKSDVKG